MKSSTLKHNVTYDTSYSTRKSAFPRAENIDTHHLSIDPQRHYENLPMQYTEMFFGCKNENFHWKNFDIFLIFAQNIDCGYTLTLEPPRRVPTIYALEQK